MSMFLKSTTLFSPFSNKCLNTIQRLFSPNVEIIVSQMTVHSDDESASTNSESTSFSSINGGDEVIQDILVYLWNNYNKDRREAHFSTSRVTKMIFLVDWFYSRHNKNDWHQLTEIDWYYNIYGPYADLIPIMKDKFDVHSYSNKKLLELKKDTTPITDALDEDVMEICKEVISKTQYLDYVRFIDFVYNTPAVELSNRFTTICIKDIARRIYK